MVVVVAPGTGEVPYAVAIAVLAPDSMCIEDMEETGIDSPD